MDLGIKGKTAIVHGAGGGLGSAIAVALAREGANIALCDINEEALSATERLVEKENVQYAVVPWDLSDIAGAAERLAHIEETIGHVDILVNNSGGPPPSLVHGVSVADWRKYFDEMILSLISVTDLVLPGMKNRGWGRIITSTSSGIISPIPNLGISNALRLSLAGWSKTLAREMGPYGITSNIILPGRIATARIRQLDEAKANRENRALDDVIQESVASIPVGRYGEPEEYGSTVAFLASERAAYITGSVVRVDGGLISSI